MLRNVLDGQFIDFEDIQELITNICYGIMTPGMAEERKQEICNGSIALQGPHVSLAYHPLITHQFFAFQVRLHIKHTDQLQLQDNNELDLVCLKVVSP